MDNMEQESVNQRIAELVQHYKKGNKSAFAKAVGISNQSLGEILGGRQSAPSFAALQKIALAYPQVRMEWLVLGQGPMLHQPDEEDTSTPSVPTSDRQEEIRQTVYDSLIENPEIKQRMADSFANIKAKVYAEQEALMRVYRVSIDHPKRRKLSERLGITEEEARELVVSGKIHAKYMGADNERARRNGASYLISERAVRDFLGKE